MSKMNELSQILDEMIACGEGMIHAANALREIFSGKKDTNTEQPAVQANVPTNVPAEPVPAAEAKTYSFTEVRKAFSAKSHAGYTDQVKALITKFGADKLSGIQPNDYPALMAELEAIG